MEEGQQQRGIRRPPGGGDTLELILEGGLEFQKVGLGRDIPREVKEGKGGKHECSVVDWGPGGGLET